MTANPFDKACRYLAHLDPPRFLQWLAPGLGDAAVFVQWLDTRTIPFPGEPDRTCDTVAEVARPIGQERWALTIAFQSQPSADMFGRLLEYLARVWRRMQGAPSSETCATGVVAALVNLTGRGESSRAFELPGCGIRTALQVGERNLASENAAATLVGIANGKTAPCILPFIPLMHGGGEPSTNGGVEATGSRRARPTTTGRLRRLGVGVRGVGRSPSDVESRPGGLERG